MKLSIEFPTLQKNMSIPTMEQDGKMTESESPGIKVNNTIDNLGESLGKFISEGKERE